MRGQGQPARVEAGIAELAEQVASRRAFSRGQASAFQQGGQPTPHATQHRGVDALAGRFLRQAQFTRGLPRDHSQAPGRIVGRGFGVVGQQRVDQVDRIAVAAALLLARA